MRSLMVILSIVSVLLSSARVLKVDSFSPSPFDQTAAVHPKKDLNGIPCSLIKIPMTGEIRDLTFEGNIVDAKNDGSEILVYFTSGTKSIVIKMVDCPPLRVTFSDFGVYRLLSKQVYNMSLDIDLNNSAHAGSSPVHIHDLLDNSDEDPVDAMVAKANQLYSDGDVSEAILLLEQAAGLGHVEALLSLGLLYENGVGKKDNWILKPNKTKAFSNVQNSAQQGYMPAQKVLSRYYITGVGVDPDVAMGDTWRTVYDYNVQQTTNKEEEVFIAVQLPAEYPGGIKALYKDLSSILQYPEVAQQNGAQGRITVSFVIEKDGSVSHSQILKSTCYRYQDKMEDGKSVREKIMLEENDESRIAFEKEALRTVGMLKRFYPGKQNGVPVRSYYSLPFNFNFQGY